MSIVLDNLTAGYDRHPAVHHITGSFAPGSLTAVIGPNGGGKSTLLKAIAGFLPPMSGGVDYQGLLPRHIAYLPQAAEVDRSFPLSVLDVVMMGFWPTVGAFGCMTKAHAHKAHHALEDVGMAAFAERPIAALSLGQWQRILFARLSLQDARLVLLDEPFAAIDNRTTHDLMHRLQAWQREGRTVVAVMHDLPLVREHFDECLMLAREMVAWGKTRDVLQDVNFAKAATLVNSWDEHAHACERAA